MIEAANHAVFFWNGKSKGTADAIEKAEGKGIPVEVVRFPIGDSASPASASPGRRSAH